MAKVVRFGLFEADLEAGELRKNGLRLRIQEQPFQVLAALLERPGEVLSRDELVARLWPDGTFVDFERGLNAAVARLRQALSDSAENPRYLETVARRGYRFIAAVGELTSPAPAPASRPRMWRWAVWPLGAALLTAAGWILYQKQATPPGPMQAVPLTTELGSELCPSLSPDGNQVAFEWSRGTAEPQIYVKLVGPGDPVRLTSGSGSEYGPAWSRDGRQIAFIRRLDPLRIGVFVIPAFGGVERKLAEFAYLEIYAWRNTHRWLDWTTDGKHLIASGAEDVSGVQGLFVIPLDGGERRRLTKPPAGILAGDRSAAVSPDGRVVAFARASTHLAAELYLLELATALVPAGEPRQLTFSAGNADSPVWIPNGREIVYTAGDPGLWRIGVGRDATPRRLDTAGGVGIFPSVARNERLAFSVAMIDVNIWRQELPVGGSAVPPAVSFIASSVADNNPQYSPDGTRIAFESDRTGRRTIWICAHDGTRCFELAAIQGVYAGTPRWSPDSRQIAYDARMTGSFDVYVINVEGGAPRRLTEHPSDNSIPSWSRDGKWVYFRSGRTGRNEIWRAPSAGGQAAQVTYNGGHVAFESADGKSLFYTKSQSGSKLWQLTLNGTEEREVADAVTWRAFAVAADRVYFMRPSAGGQASIVSLAPATGRVSLIARMPRPLGEGLSLSPDGRYLLYSQVDHSGSDLTLLEGFR